MGQLSAGNKQAGFTLQEVLVVIAIGLIITTVAVPIMSSAIANVKLRSSLTSVSGLLQNTRAMAVQQNKAKTACHFSRTSAIFIGLFREGRHYLHKQHDGGYYRFSGRA